MAVVSVTRKWSTDEGQDQSDDGKKWRRTLAEAWDVVIDDPENTSVYEAKFAAGIPRVRSFYPSDPTMRVNSVQPRRKSPITWEVYVGYEANTSDKDNEGPTNPLAQPPTVEWFAVLNEDYTDTDINNKPMLNTVGDPLEPVPIQLVDLGLRIQRNLASFDASVIYTYTGAVNSDAFGPFPVGTCRVVNLQSSEVYDDEIIYFPTSIEIHIRQPRNTTAANAWWSRRRNEGFYYYKSPISQKNKVRVTDDLKEYITVPALLNADGSLVDVKNNANAHWLEFQLHPERPFSYLGIF